MINSQRENKSIYEAMFDQAIKDMNKHTSNHVKNIGQSINSNQNEKAANNIVLITKLDNLVHNYFHYFEVYWDASDCQSQVIVRFPKTNSENTKYWLKYQGDIWIYTGNNIGKETINNQTFYEGMDEMMPIFVGSISHITETYDEIEIFINSIGIRFKQKIPDEFRQSFINNQNVRDAFQAICEFLGVKYICPPKTESSTGDADEATAGETTDGTETDASHKTQVENKTVSAVRKQVDAAKKIANKGAKTISRNVGSQVAGAANGTNGTSTDPNDPNAIQNGDESLDASETEAPQDGYSDVSFDSAGNIVHGSAIIETSPDMAETLIAMEESRYEGYVDDETGIVEDITKFLNGYIFEELHNRVMDYGAITIEPKSAPTTNMSTVQTNTPTDPNAQNGQNTNGTTGDSNNGSNGTNGTGA